MTLIPAFDPGRVRWHVASFTAVGKDKKLVTIDVSARIRTLPVGPYGPGDGPATAHASLTPKEFVQIADALSVTGTLLNARVTFRDDQLRALRSLGQRVGLIGR